MRRFAALLPIFRHAPAAAPVAKAAAAPAAKADAKAAPAAEAKKEPMDINTATEKELASLPKIGDVRAKAIVKGRPYNGKDDLINKKIVPQDAYDAIKDVIIAKQAKKEEPKKEAAKEAPKKDEKKK
ncbi:MAG: helix-hairpin-helix domain-containing protein [Betaproteobacteria bacterium]|nr:helix-hairpin-helix domain-containing protein [Betaproteobacteria bacterium]